MWCTRDIATPASPGLLLGFYTTQVDKSSLEIAWYFYRAFPYENLTRVYILEFCKSEPYTETQDMTFAVHGTALHQNMFLLVLYLLSTNQSIMVSGVVYDEPYSVLMICTLCL